MFKYLTHLNLLELPSGLWGTHVNSDFIAIVEINLKNEVITIGKSILITAAKVEIRINGEIVPFTLTKRLEQIQDVSALVKKVDDVKTCECGKFIFNRELCASCMPSPTEKGPEKEKRFLCTICGQMSLSGAELELHYAIHASPQEKPFKCESCGRSFAKKYNLNVHSRIHSGEKPYVCSHCGKTFTSRSNLQTHTNSVHLNSKKYQCEFCDSNFVHPRHLRLHLRKHTGEKPYKCKVCGKTFTKNVHLTVHNRTHTGERPYKCTVCERGFTTTGNLNTHRKSCQL